MNIWTIAVGYLALTNFVSGVLEINFNLQDSKISMNCFVNSEINSVNELSIQKLNTTKTNWIIIGTAKEGQNVTPYLENYKITGGINSTQPNASRITVTFPLTELKEDDNVVFLCHLSYRDKNNEPQTDKQNGTIFVKCKATDSTSAVDRCSLSTSAIVFVFILAYFSRQ